MAKIISPGRNRAIIDDVDKPTQQVTTWMQAVSRGAQLLEGEGSPENIQEGFLGWDYFDKTNLIFYKKSTAGGKNGWIQMNT
jgi:hypothetical protein